MLQDRAHQSVTCHITKENCARDVPLRKEFCLLHRLRPSPGRTCVSVNARGKRKTNNANLHILWGTGKETTWLSIRLALAMLTLMMNATRNGEVKLPRFSSKINFPLKLIVIWSAHHILIFTNARENTRTTCSPQFIAICDFVRAAVHASLRASHESMSP